MATSVRESAIRSVTVNQTVAANNAISLDTEVPPTGQAIVVDSLGLSGAGTVQTSTSWTLADSGGTTLILGYAASPGVAGLIEFHESFPGGVQGTSGLKLNFSAAACANVPLRAWVTYHLERG